MAYEHAQRLPHSSYLGPDPAVYISYLRATVAEELAFALEQRGQEAAVMEHAVEQIATSLGIVELLAQDPTKLSGGQTRLVALAMVILVGAPQMVVEQPCDGLDPYSITRVLEVLAEYPGEVFAYSAAEIPGISGSWIEPPQTYDLPQRIQRSEHGVPIVCEQLQGLKLRRRFLRAPVVEFTTPTVDLVLQRGQVVWLAGANGIGKTTMLQQLALHPPQNITVAYATQRAIDHIVETTVAAYLGSEAATIALGLDPQMHPLDLSAGQLRLAQIARTLNREVDLIILDEPDVCLEASMGTFHQLCAQALARPYPPAIILTCHKQTVITEIQQYATVVTVQLGGTARIE